MGCSKPNCDCLEKEEKRIGGPVKYGYPCLGDRFKGDEIKSPKLPSTPQPGEEARNFVWYSIDVQPTDDSWILLIDKQGHFGVMMTDKDDYSLSELNTYQENEASHITHWAYIGYPE